MFRQNAIQFARTTQIRQPVTSSIGKSVFLMCQTPHCLAAQTHGPTALSRKQKVSQAHSPRSFSTGLCMAINRGFWTLEGKRRDFTARLFQKTEEERLQQEEQKRQEARKREEEARKQREAVIAIEYIQVETKLTCMLQEADIGCDNPLDGIYHRSIYSDYGRWEGGGYGGSSSGYGGSGSDSGYDGGGGD